jgi:hypothetical protein
MSQSLKPTYYSKIVSGLKGQEDLVHNFEEITIKQNIETQQWINFLISLGVKAAHPDDGWVNREKNSIKFAYPHFNNNPKVGDVICLGWANHNKNRLVRVIKYPITGILSKSREYYFEAIL